MSVFDKLLGQAKYLLGSNLFSAGLNFLSILMLVKILDIKSFGVFTLLQAYVLVFAGVFNPQAWQGLIKYLANNEHHFIAIIRHTIYYDLLMAIIGGVSAFFGASFYIQLMNIDPQYLTLLQLMCLYVLFNQLSTSIGLLRYFDEFKKLALQNIVASLVMFFSVTIGWLMEFSLSYFCIMAIFSLVMGNFIINIYSFLLFKKRFKPTCEPLPKSKANALLKFNIFAHLTNIVDIPVKQLDTVLVGYFLSAEVSGVFKLIKQIGTITTKFTGPVTQVLYPEVNKCLASNDVDKLSFVFWKFTFVIGCIAIPSAIILGITSSYWIPIVFTPYYANYSFELACYLVVHAVSVSFLAVHPTFLALGYIKRLLLITIVANALFVIGVMFLAPFWGLKGVIFAIFIQYSVTVLCKLIPVMNKMRKHTKEVLL
ncbi:lipopolysaccharide biosynthesis protein [Thalassotalea piscium]